MSSLRVPALFWNLALAAASTIVFAGLVEGVARLVEPPPVQKEEYLWDWSQRFKDGDFYTLEKGEGYPPSEETNVDGLRDATRPVETRDGLKRIVVLGDSVAYGHGVEGAEAFPQLLERTLREKGRDIEVFNMALPGWSTRQERIAYERIGRKYRPDTVVLAVCLNDLAELQINLARPPGFVLALFKRSAAVRMALGASNREIGAVEELFAAADSPRVQNAFRLFFDEVRGLRSLTEKDGAAFNIVVFPFRFQVEPKAPPPSVQRRIAEFATVEKISHLDFLPQIATSTSSGDFFLDYDHFSRTGHEAVAAWLAGLPQIAGAGPFVNPLSSKAANPSPRESLAELTNARSDEVRERVLWRMKARPEVPAERAGPDASRLLEAVVNAAVDEVSPRVRFAAAEVVFTLGTPGTNSVGALIRGVEHEDPRVRAFATWTLGEMGESAKDAVPALVALARKDGGAGRTGALTAIGKIGGGSPETIPLLLQELKHTKEARRYRAARTIGRMGPAAASAVSGLIDALHDPSALVRLHVVRALGDVGDAARVSVPALVEILNKDPDPGVRKEASMTLSKLPGR